MQRVVCQHYFSPFFIFHNTRINVNHAQIHKSIGTLINCWLCNDGAQHIWACRFLWTCLLMLLMPEPSGLIPAQVGKKTLAVGSSSAWTNCFSTSDQACSNSASLCSGTYHSPLSIMYWFIRNTELNFAQWQIRSMGPLHASLLLHFQWLCFSCHLEKTSLSWWCFFVLCSLHPLLRESLHISEYDNQWALADGCCRLTLAAVYIPPCYPCDCSLELLHSHIAAATFSCYLR